MIALAAAACSRAPRPAVLRLAILPFENLTGDASLDWISTAAPSILGAQLVGSRDLVPFRAATMSEGYLANASRFVRGTFTRPRGELRFEIEVEDGSAHKMIAENVIRGNVLEAMDRAAHLFETSPRPFSTSNEEAVAAWARGDEERAVALDPDFGAAWIAWAEAAAKKESPAEAVSITDRALQRTTLRSPIDRARLEVLSATLRQDQPARQKALLELQKLDPADTNLSERLAQAETEARDFEGAAKLYRQILAEEPENTAAMLALGYNLAYAGDVDSARKTFEEYSTREGQKTNALDSLGELYFMNGRFPDAEKYFLEAHDASPGFLGGADLLKAAYAHWLAGDLQHADVIFARYLEYRRAQRDPLIAWREASWLYSTGRPEQAMKALAEAPRPLAERQAAAWNAAPSKDLAALKPAYERSSPSSDGLVRTLYASALVEAGDKEQAKKLAARWPLPTESGQESLLDSTIFPRFLKLRKALH